MDDGRETAIDSTAEMDCGSLRDGKLGPYRKAHLRVAKAKMNGPVKMFRPDPFPRPLFHEAVTILRSFLAKAIAVLAAINRNASVLARQNGVALVSQRALH